ncbi:hypothetical protein HMPREF0623_1074 [Pediococcus acidilactici DSM 20284]|uniref:Uncharacterized protein n=1 Tax=Pediococcus acidilactici DSM 20284 TaxID=862514 RepID=E0NGM7_PEDAC|nr:hypothetical protein HMPREF0623_1074 [Pediococcus acidilactici DSM 20284]
MVAIKGIEGTLTPLVLRVVTLNLYLKLSDNYKNSSYHYTITD